MPIEGERERFAYFRARINRILVRIPEYAEDARVRSGQRPFRAYAIRALDSAARKRIRKVFGARIEVEADTVEIGPAGYIIRVFRERYALDESGRVARNARYLERSRTDRIRLKIGEGEFLVRDVLPELCREDAERRELKEGRVRFRESETHGALIYDRNVHAGPVRILGALERGILRFLDRKSDIACRDRRAIGKLRILAQDEGVSLAVSGYAIVLCEHGNERSGPRKAHESRVGERGKIPIGVADGKERIYESRTPDFSLDKGASIGGDLHEERPLERIYARKSGDTDEKSEHVKHSPVSRGKGADVSSEAFNR